MYNFENEIEIVNIINSKPKLSLGEIFANSYQKLCLEKKLGDSKMTCKFVFFWTSHSSKNLRIEKIIKVGI